MTTTNGYKYTDFTYLNNLVMGDNEFKKKIINMFIDKTPAIIKNIQDSYQNSAGGQCVCFILFFCSSAALGKIEISGSAVA